jgi:predicted ATPase with chaperone activity
MRESSESWKETYFQTILEVNGQKMQERIAATREAIAGRLRNLEHDSNHHMERHKMEKALTTLKTLQAETRNW